MKNLSSLKQQFFTLFSFLLLPILMVAQPGNDDCANATLLTLSPVCTITSATTVDATDSGVAHGCITYQDHDVWFSFVTPPSGNVTIQTSNRVVPGGGTFDDIAVVYDDCLGTTEVGCDDAGGDTNIVLTGLTDGSTYYIVIAPYNTSATGTFDICAFETPPVNDDCVDATGINTDILNCTSTTSGNNFGATDSGIAHTGLGYLGGDVWFSFVAPASGEITVETSDDGSGNFDTVIEVYEGDCTSLVSIGSDDDGAATGNFSILTLTGLTEGDTYYVAVWEYNNNDFGTFNICAWDPNPPCAPAMADLTRDDTDCANDLFDIVVNLSSLGVATTVDINHNGTSLDNETNVGIGTYTLSGFGPTEGIITVAITDNNDPLCITEFTIDIPTGCPTINDNCDMATPLTMSNSSCGNPEIGTNINASDSGVEHNGSGYLGGDVWFSFVAPASQQVTIETSDDGSGNFDTVIEVYGGDCMNLITVNNNDQGGIADFSLLELTGLVAGDTYFVAVWEYQNDNFGTFNICAWDPSTCEDAMAGLLIGSTDCTIDLYDIVIDLTSIGIATAVNITHDGSSSDNETNVIEGMYTLSGFGPTDGIVTVSITDSNDPLCFTEFTILIPAACPPINDNCDMAIPLILSNSGCANPETGTNINATDSGVEHNGNGYLGGDVWFSFVAPASQQVTIETSDDGSGGIDTVIEVYGGADCTSLVSVDSDDDGSAGDFSLLELTGLVAGDTYFVEVWEYNNDDFGTFNICAWDPSTCLTQPTATVTTVNENCAAGTYDIQVEVTGLGPGTSVDINHGGTSPTSYTGVPVGTYTLVGFLTSEWLVDVTISNNADPLCFSEITVGLPNCPPENDECSDAIALTINPDLTCNNSVQATLANATASTEPLPGNCVGTEGDANRWEDDIWFSFTATAEFHVIQSQNFQNGSGDLVYHLTEGTCASYVDIACHDEPEESWTTPMLTVGNDYLLRIASFNTVPETTVFDICIGIAPPDNDDCDNATALSVSNSSCATPITGTNLGATDSGVAHSCGGYQGGDVWFSFVAPASGFLTLETSDSGAGNINTVIGVYDDCTNLISQGCDVDGSDAPGNFSRLELSGLVGGETYYAAVWQFNNNLAKSFNICAWDPSTCEDATASLFIDDSNCASDSYDIIIDLTDLGLATLVNISHDGSSAGGASGVGTGTYTFSGFPLADDLVTITITDSNDPLCFTEFMINIVNTCPPINDDCSSPIVLTPTADLACASPVAGTIANATASPEATPLSCSGSVGNASRWEDDVWFSFIATSKHHEIQMQNIQNGSSDLIFQLAEGSCGALVDLFCHDTPDSGFITPELVVGTNYLLRIASYSNFPQTTEFEICIGTPPCVDVSTTLAIDAINCGSNLYNIDIDLTGLGQATSVNITHDGSSPSSLTGVGEGMYTLSNFADTDGLVNVTFTDANDPACTTGLSIAIPTVCPPLNDNCGGAVVLTVNPDLNCGVVTSATVEFATSSPEPDCGNGIADDDIWFSFVATAVNNTVSILNAAGSTTDMFHEVLQGGCGSLIPLATAVCSDGNFSNPSGLTIGATYHVRVYTYTSTTGQTTTFDVCIGTPPPPPANDDCGGAIALTVNPDLNCGSVTSGTVQSATASPEPECGNGTADDDVWFTFVATATKHSIDLINTTNGTSDLFHEVLMGGCGSLVSLTNPTCSDNNSSSPDGLSIGVTYYLRVYTYTSTPGQTTTFDVCIGTPPPPPANDDCGGAIAITVNPNYGCSMITSGTVQSATASPETTCGGTADDDVWFTFVAASTEHTIDLINITNGTTDLYHEVMMGACGSLVPLTTPDCSDSNSSTAAGLTIGDTYHLRVYTFTSIPGQSSTFDVCIGTEPTCPSPTSLFTTNETLTGADVSWIEAGIAGLWDLEFVQVGFSPTGTPTVSGHSTMSYTWTGGTAGTGYEVYVRADCTGGDESIWEGPISFVTLCDPNPIVPDYCENFETIIFPSSCWTEASGTDDITGLPTFFGSGEWFNEDFGHDNAISGFSAAINLYNLGTEDWLFSPTFDLSAGNHEVNFDIALTGFNSSTAGVDTTLLGDDVVEFLISVDAGASWSIIQTWDMNSVISSTGQAMSFDLAAYTGSTVQLAFRGDEGTEDIAPGDINFYVDNFCVDFTFDPCPPNLTLTGTNAGDDSDVNNRADNESSGEISSTQVISGTATIDYDSATEITLDGGFEVEVGATFEAFIDGCNEGAGGSN